MPLVIRLSVCLLLVSNSPSVPAADAVARQSGWNVAALRRIDPAGSGYLTHSSLLIDGSGEILWTWGDIDEKLQVFSMRKSLLSALYGMLLSKGKLDLNDTLEQLGIDDKQGLTEREKSASLRDLLMSRSGIYHPAAFETPRMFNDRPERGRYGPGEHWFYNNWDFNALNTIFENAAGRRVAEAFKTFVADPLDMQHFSTADVQYVYEDASIHPAVTFRMSAADLGKFGLLMLREGQWDDRQVIPSEWVRESTKAHSDLGMFGGFGYSWWAAMHGDHLPRLRFPDGTYAARGTGEQMILVLPSLNAVWVHRTRVDSPDQTKMHVSETARLLTQILDAHTERNVFRDPRF